MTNNNANANTTDTRPFHVGDAVQHKDKTKEPSMYGAIVAIDRKNPTDPDPIADVELAPGARGRNLDFGIVKYPLSQLVLDSVFGREVDLDLAKVGEHGLRGVLLAREGSIGLVLVRLPMDSL